jgi:hypothetical protein
LSIYVERNAGLAIITASVRPNRALPNSFEVLSERRSGLSRGGPHGLAIGRLIFGHWHLPDVGKGSLEPPLVRALLGNTVAKFDDDDRCISAKRSSKEPMRTAKPWHGSGDRTSHAYLSICHARQSHRGPTPLADFSTGATAIPVMQKIIHLPFWSLASSKPGPSAATPGFIT